MYILAPSPATLPQSPFFPQEPSFQSCFRLLTLLVTKQWLSVSLNSKSLSLYLRAWHQSCTLFLESYISFYTDSQFVWKFSLLPAQFTIEPERSLSWTTQKIGLKIWLSWKNARPYSQNTGLHPQHHIELDMVVHAYNLEMRSGR